MTKPKNPMRVSVDVSEPVRKKLLRQVDDDELMREVERRGIVDAEVEERAHGKAEEWAAERDDGASLSHLERGAVRAYETELLADTLRDLGVSAHAVQAVLDEIPGLSFIPGRVA
mgnify:CR=1 FL=1